MIRGSRWECGYCGDFGNLAPQKQAPVSTVTLTFSIDTSFDYTAMWKEMTDVLGALSHGDSLWPLLRDTVLYEISRALAEPRHTNDEEKFRELDTFLQDCIDFAVAPPVRELLNCPDRFLTLYKKQGQLTQSVCGQFWQQLIPKIQDEGQLRDIDPLFENLGALCRQFLCDEPDDRVAQLEEDFSAHWHHYRFFHPDGKAAAARLKEDCTDNLHEDCRDILVAAYPEFFQGYSLESMEDFYLDDILAQVWEQKPSLAISMMDTLLQQAGPDVEDALWTLTPFTKEVWGYYHNLRK